jgi:hypothetical protein
VPDNPLSALDPTNPILPPFMFEHLGLTYHVFADLSPRGFPHGADFDVYLPGSIESVAHVHLERGELVCYVRGLGATQLRQGTREARRQYDAAKVTRPELSLIPEQKLADGYTTPDGVRYWVLLDVDPERFPQGLNVSVCATGEISAFPAVGVPAGDLLVKLDADVADKLRPGFLASYAKAMKMMEQRRAVHG